MKPIVDCGQYWFNKNGFSCSGIPCLVLICSTDIKDIWECKVFWKLWDGNWGGAHDQELTTNEILEFDFIGVVPSYMCVRKPDITE